MIYLSKEGGGGADSDHTWIRSCILHAPNVDFITRLNVKSGFTSKSDIELHLYGLRLTIYTVWD